MILRNLVLLAALSRVAGQECNVTNTTVLTLTPTITPVTQPPFPGLTSAPTTPLGTLAPTPGGQLTTNEDFDPTMAPTSGPTFVPTSPPSPATVTQEEPTPGTAAPTSAPTVDCIPNVMYVPDNVDYGPVQVLSQEGSAVTFGVSQTWSDSPICLLGVDFLSAGSNQDECDVHDTVLPGEVGKYTAKCYNGYADITVYLQDAMFTAPSPATVVPTPRCGPIESEGPNTISYEVRIPCIPECEPGPAPLECDGSADMPITEDTMDGDDWMFSKPSGAGLTVADGAEEMVKTYSVPVKASAVVLTIDMVELKALTEEFLRIGDTYINFGDFSPSATEPKQSGMMGDIYAVVEPFGATADRITLTIPKEWYPTGRLTVAISGGVGIETVKLNAICSAPTAPPTYDCIPNIVYTSEKFDYPPVEILSQDIATVTFAVSQTWSDSPICLLGVDYHSAQFDALHCDTEDTVPPGEMGSFTAKCVNGYADITIYLEDAMFDATSPVDVPGRCTDITSRGPHTISYDVRVPCEMECDDMPGPKVCDGSKDMPIASESFEQGQASTWLYGSESTTPSGTKCLNAMGTETTKTYDVPATSSGIILRFTFVEDEDVREEFMRIQDAYFDLGSFFRSKTEDAKEGFWKDVWVVVTPIDAVTNSITMVVPNTWYPRGRLTIGFNAKVCVDHLGLSSICSGSITDVEGYGSTIAPTAEPTAAPTKAPTRPPTAAPTEAPTVDCIPNIMYTPDPQGLFPAVELISQDTTSVTFGVSQTFADKPICLLGVDYYPADGNEDVCDVHDTVMPGEIGTYRAKCINGWAEISVYAQDAIFTGTNVAVPGRCSPIVDKGPDTIGYDVKVPCVPECEPIAGPPVCDGTDDMPVYSESFNSGAASDWFSGLTGTSGGKKYLYTTSGEAVMTFAIPTAAYGLTIRFEMIELQSLTSEFLRIQDAFVDLGHFNKAATDSSKEGFLSDVWGVVTPTSATKDTVTLIVPASWYPDGRLTVAFGPGVGIDHFAIHAICSTSLNDHDAYGKDTTAPTAEPTEAPTKKPTLYPTRPPTLGPTSKPTPAPTEPKVVVQEDPSDDCPYYNLDFNDSGVYRGQYITDDFKADYGVTIKAVAAKSGYTPGGAARIFDTSNTGGSYGDTDLGSPNESCGGPGVGDGGKKGSPYENCVPLGNVLIIQESNKNTPDDNYKGGYIEFTFDEPAYLDKIVILDSEGSDDVELEMTLTDGSKEHRYGEKTGNNGVSHLQVGVGDVEKLRVTFPNSGAIASLGYHFCPDVTTADLPTGGQTTAAPTPSPVQQCPLVKLDFNNEGLSRGTYLTTQLKPKYGLTVQAWATSGGYTPGGAARVFDTANPGGSQGDTDLGSPNENCPGGGPGIGNGGKPGQPYSNCVPLGYVLIVQESNKSTPDDNAGGGTILFTFDTPIAVETLYILDIDENRYVDVTVEYAGGATELFRTGYTGDNGVYPLAVNKENVKKIKVYFPGSGAVSEIDFTYCPP